MYVYQCFVCFIWFLVHISVDFSQLLWSMFSRPQHGSSLFHFRGEILELLLVYQYFSSFIFRVGIEFVDVHKMSLTFICSTTQRWPWLDLVPVQYPFVCRRRRLRWILWSGLVTWPAECCRALLAWPAVLSCPDDSSLVTVICLEYWLWR